MAFKRNKNNDVGKQMKGAILDDRILFPIMLKSAKNLIVVGWSDLVCAQYMTHLMGRYISVPRSKSTKEFVSETYLCVMEGQDVWDIQLHEVKNPVVYFTYGAHLMTREMIDSLFATRPVRLEWDRRYQDISANTIHCPVAVSMVRSPDGDCT